MIAIIAGVVGLVVLGAGWARVAAGRSERHSVENYEHALDVLGGVAKRGEGVGTRTPDEDEIARPHIRPALGPERVRPLENPEAVPTPRLRLRPPASVANSAAERAGGSDNTATTESQLSTSESGLASAGGGGGESQEASADVAISFDDLPAPIEISTARRDRALRRAERGAATRVVTVAAAVVVLAALAVGGWRLESSRGRPSAALPPTSHPKKQAHSVSTTTTVPPQLVPVATTSSLVSYTVPASTYTISFNAIGPCWLGIQRDVSGGYLWEETLSASGQATYSTTGVVYVRIGAPTQVSIAVDGVPVDLPKGNEQPYSISLTPIGATGT